MTKFEQFQEAFKKHFEENGWEFLYEEQEETVLGGKLVENLDEQAYDSYGSEDSTLRRVYYFADFDIFVAFEGTRCSYQGEEWDDYKEVKKVDKIITVWE